MDIYLYHDSPPPEPSAGLRKWMPKIRAGWRPNRRLSRMGYSTACDYYGIYVWEYKNVLMPALEAPRAFAQEDPR